MEKAEIYTVIMTAVAQGLKEYFKERYPDENFDEIDWPIPANDESD